MTVQLIVRDALAAGLAEERQERREQKKRDQMKSYLKFRWAWCEERSTTIIDQAETHGKGAAIQQAIEEWKKEPTPFVVLLDADGSYSFDAVVDVISELKYFSFRTFQIFTWLW